MDHMQASLLQLMETANRPQPRQTARTEDRKGFRKLMEERQAPQEQAEQTEPVREETTPLKAQRREDELLQQLAAMQLICPEPVVQPVTPEEAQPMLLTPMTAPTAAQTAPVQPQGEVLPQTQAQPETAAAQAEQIPQEAKNQTAAVTAPEQPEQKQLHQDLNRQPADKPRAEQTGDKTEVLQSPGQPEQVFSRVETAPVKVSETVKPQTESQNVAKQVTDQVARALQKGERRVQIQLTPEHLGRITVELTEKGDGALHIALHADSSRTRSLLERELPLMQTVLSRDTQQTVEVHVPRQQDAQQNAFDQQGREQHQQNPQQQDRRQHRPEADFLHQLRLGLVPTEEVS